MARFASLPPCSVARRIIVMIIRRGLAIRAVAAVSVLTSVVAMALSDHTGHPLPVAIVNVAVIAGAAAVMSVLLHERTPDNNLWRVLLASAVIGPLAVVLLAAAQMQSQPPGALVAALWMLDVPLTIPWVLFFGLFPDGHGPIKRWPVLVAGAVAFHAAVAAVAWYTAPEGAAWPVQGHLPGARADTAGGVLHVVSAHTSSALTGLLPLAAGLCLVHRYRRSGPVVRQQIRVGVAGLLTTVVLELAFLTLPGAGSWPVRIAISVATVGVGLLGVAAALLRWRLWIVDQALPRAVVLSACSVAISAVIVAGALAATGSVGTTQVQGAVPLAVLVSVLVQGYSRRLEPWVRRLVYGERPGGFAVLVGLADGLTGLDVETAAVRIADAARRGLAVPWAALWVPTARERVFRLTARAGEVAAPPVMQLDLGWVDGREGARLLADDVDRAPLPDDTAAVTVLSADVGPWGLLAIGQRRGEPLTVGDVELLNAITREASLAHVNRRLVDEVAASMQELQARAKQIQQSRQRLVAAQDEERRRIERDLHDGTQHDLVALAGRLRQLAKGPPVAKDVLEELADQAEHAVFSLQDLARGIYPSVLTDRGVAAAIRSYVGRLPVDIVLHIAPETARRRWAAELEVALYFVVVESLGNSRKHSTATTVTVTLAELANEVILEVHDNGDGFDPGAVVEGSGLQHMADRMAAVSGALAVTSRPGAGTWITARAPAEASTVTEGVVVSGRSPTLADIAVPPVPGD
jgi:signal transduction histidine kinase